MKNVRVRYNMKSGKNTEEKCGEIEIELTKEEAEAYDFAVWHGMDLNKVPELEAAICRAIDIVEIEEYPYCDEENIGNLDDLDDDLEVDEGEIYLFVEFVNPHDEMWGDELEMKVFIQRGGFNSGGMEIEVSKLRNVHWSNISGGVGRKLPYDSLFAYAPYSLIAEGGVACSGTHAHYGNDAKVEIPKGINQDAKYRAGYEYLVKNAAGFRSSGPSRGSGPYCCRRITAILSETVMERYALINKLHEEGYWVSTAKNVLRRLTRERIIEKYRENKQTMYKLNEKK